MSSQTSNEFFCVLLVVMFSRWCASTLLSIPLCLTTSCCTVSPKQRRCTTTTPEAPPVSTHLGRRPAASVSSAGITRCANTECRDQSCRAKKKQITAQMCQWAAFPVAMNLCNASSPVLHRDGDAHVHRWRPGHV